MTAIPLPYLPPVSPPTIAWDAVLVVANVILAGVVAVKALEMSTEDKADSNPESTTEECPDEGKQDKRLSKGEIKKLQENGYDPHDLKPKKDGSKFDLFKDRNGNIKVKPKNGSGPGEPTGININDL